MSIYHFSPRNKKAPQVRGKGWQCTGYLADRAGLEPATCRLTADRTCLMCFLPNLVDLVGIEPTGPKSTVLQTAEANHIAHKIQNLVCPEGFEPSTTWFQTKYATRLRYGQRLPVTLSGVSISDFRLSN